MIKPCTLNRTLKNGLKRKRKKKSNYRKIKTKALIVISSVSQKSLFACNYYFLGRLAPYLERPWRLASTPDVSNVPRTV